MASCVELFRTMIAAQQGLFMQGDLSYTSTVGCAWIRLPYPPPPLSAAAAYRRRGGMQPIFSRHNWRGNVVANGPVAGLIAILQAASGSMGMRSYSLLLGL